MTLEKAQKSLLILAGIGLIPIALGYGFMPEKTLTPLYGFDVENVNLKHIMRAVMGLYFGQIIIWFLGVSSTKLRMPAMYCLVVFMLGLAAGRVLSLILDGVAHWLLIVYLVLELTIGLIGLSLIRKENKTK
ncbi:DUF4345 domain-containing protein [Cryomorphaceae bacterium 1068]|nr:DUF4345 domain-containing protein [Cryomorphaceae bacterium 1068]